MSGFNHNYLRISKAKSSSKWDSDTPRCATCEKFRKPAIVKNAPHNIKVTAFCNAMQFTTKANACCDLWVGKNGDVLNVTPD